MVAPSSLPRIGAPIAGAGGQVTQQWRDFFLRLASQTTDATLAAELRALADRVRALEDSGAATDAEILGLGSVTAYGTLANGLVQIQLVGDNLDAPPGADSYYGTDAAGSRGFHPLPRSGVLPVVTGEVSGGQPVFVHADDGSLIYSEVA